MFLSGSLTFIQCYLPRIFYHLILLRTFAALYQQNESETCVIVVGNKRILYKMEQGMKKYFRGNITT